MKGNLFSLSGYELAGNRFTQALRVGLPFSYPGCKELFLSAWEGPQLRNLTSCAHQVLAAGMSK